MEIKKVSIQEAINMVTDAIPGLQIDPANLAFEDHSGRSVTSNISHHITGAFIEAKMKTSWEDQQSEGWKETERIHIETCNSLRRLKKKYRDVVITECGREI